MSNIISWESSVERWRSVLKEHKEYIEQDDRKVILGIFKALGAQVSINKSLNEITLLQVNLISIKMKYSKKLRDAKKAMTKHKAALYLSEASAPSEKKKTKEFINYAVSEDEEFSKLEYKFESLKSIFFTLVEILESLFSRDKNLREISTNVRKDMKADIEI